MRRSSQHHTHERHLHEPIHPSSATGTRMAAPYKALGSAVDTPGGPSSAYHSSIPLPSHFGTTTSTAPSMPPSHTIASNNTIYIPVVSPPTPEPSPGPIEPAQLFPSSSPSSAYHPPQSPSSVVSSEVQKLDNSPPSVRRQLLSTLVAACTPEELLFISNLIAPRLKRDFLSSLPTELALHVLSFVEDPMTLCRAERVCKRWAVLCREEAVWRRLVTSWNWIDDECGEDANRLLMYDRQGYTGGRFAPEFGGKYGNAEGSQDGWQPRLMKTPCTPSPTTSEDPLEEMEQFANFPTDPALEWLITKRRQELVGGGGGSSSDMKGKGKAKMALTNDLELLDDMMERRPFSSRDFFKACYVTMSNWRHGGTLLRSHQIPPLTPPGAASQLPSSAAASNTSNASQSRKPLAGPVVTSVALDAEWAVIALANSRIQIYSARTGVLAKTLVGHESGVWSVGLVSKGGWMACVESDSEGQSGSDDAGSDADSGPPSPGSDGSSSREGSSSRDGSHRRRSAEMWASAAAAAASSSPRTKSKRSAGSRHRPVGNGHIRRGSEDATPALDHLVPARLRVAVGLDPEPEQRRPPSPDDDSDGDGGHGFAGGARGPKRSGRDDCKPRPQAKRRVSDMCHSSVGWGQPNAILVSGGCDKVLMVWDVKTGHCIYRLSGHTSTIRCVRVLDNRPIAVSASRDGTVRVWDIQRGRCLRVLRGHQSPIRALDCAGSLVVSGSYDCTVRVWNVDTGECVHVLEGHFHQIYSVAFDGKYIASGSLDTTVRLWDVETGSCIALVQGHTALVSHLQLSPKYLVTGGSDGRVITFDLDTLSIKQRIAAHDCSVTGMQFVERPGVSSRAHSLSSLGTYDAENKNMHRNAEDNFVVTSGNDGRVRLYTVEGGEFVRDLGCGGESVWKVVSGWGRCVVVCKRAGKTVVEVWSMRPEEREALGGGSLTRTESMEDDE